MAGSLDIKRRIKSVKNTKKITKAMELVSASKMKKAVSSVLSSRPYAVASLDVLNILSNIKSEVDHPLVKKRDIKNILIVLISSNRGLCGAYNTQIFKRVTQMMKNDKDINISFVTVGKKGESFVKRLGSKIIASFTELSENPSLREVLPIGNIVMSEFQNGNFDIVYVAYTDYESALVSKPNIRHVLPISIPEVEKTVSHLGSNTDKPISSGKNKKDTYYLVEPNYNTVANKVIEKVLKAQVYQMLLESSASEQSSRMMAMKNANEAAGEMIDDLTLAFNKARQAAITKEISEISAGMASVS